MSPAPSVETARVHGDRAGVLAAAARIGAELAGPAAADVDRAARFPLEAVTGMREAGLLSALVPTSFGGGGASLTEVAGAVRVLGRHCSSSGMILAMHSIQVACLARHGRGEYLETLLSRIAADQLLLASATTEKGVGGDVRTSICAVETLGDRFRLEKQAMVISYGQQADVILATARRSPDSPPNDQVLVACEPPGLLLELTGGWDVLGFRGTCSPGFRLVAEGSMGQVLPEPYGDISAHTMLPVSHLLWSSLWAGMAGAAVDKATRFVQAAARQSAGSAPPGAARLAELWPAYQQLSAMVSEALAGYERVMDDPDATSGIGFALAMNTLKVAASTMVADIVGRALLICGMAGYRDDGPYSLGRLLRDAHGAALMVSNDRILKNNAQLLLVHRDV